VLGINYLPDTSLKTYLDVTFDTVTFVKFRALLQYFALQNTRAKRIINNLQTRECTDRQTSIKISTLTRKPIIIKSEQPYRIIKLISKYCSHKADLFTTKLCVTLDFSKNQKCAVFGFNKHHAVHLWRAIKIRKAKFSKIHFQEQIFLGIIKIRNRPNRGYFLRKIFFRNYSF